MARTVNDSRYPAYLPRNWRVMTAAGVTTMGLACGLVQPALAEWWKLSKPETPAATMTGTVGRTGSTENGFAATIRRLLAESRRAAEQGDHAKAVQLAERAAKISEAASQVVGPAAECSPQETARFLAEMRTRSSGPAATIAAQPTVTPAPPTQKVDPPDTRTTVAVAPVSPPVQKPASVPAVPPSRMAAAPPLPAALLPRPAQTLPQPPEPKQVADAMTPTATPANVVASPSQQPSPPRRSVATSGRASIARSNSHPPLQRVATVEKPLVAKAAGTAIPPSPSIAPVKTGPNAPTNATSKTGSSAPTKSGELLAQSRLAAADGRLDRAIELAEQAVEASRGPALFGPVLSNTSADEATRWRNKLLTQQLSSQRDASPEPKEEIFEQPLRVASVRRRTPALPVADEHDPFANEPRRSLPGEASSAVDDDIANRAQDLNSGPAGAAAITATTVPQPSVASTTSPSPQDDPQWSHELPTTPASLARREREPIKFSRSVISRSGGWVDADWNDAAAEESVRPSTESRVTIESRATIESNASSTQTPPPSDLRASADVVEPAHTSAPGDSIEPAIESTIEPTPQIPVGDVTKSDPTVTSRPAASEPGDDVDRGVGAIDTGNETVIDTVAENGTENGTETVTKTVTKTVTETATEIMTEVVTVTATTEASGPVPARGAIRLRGGIQQIAAEFPVPNPEAPRLPDEDTTIQTVGGPSSSGTTVRIPATETEWAADATDESAATEIPVQRFPVQRVIQLRRRLESASSLNPGGWSAETSQPPSTVARQTEPIPEKNRSAAPDEPDVKSAGPTGSEWHEQNRAIGQSPAVAGRRAPVKLRERSRLQIDDPADGGSPTASTVPKPPGQPRQPAVGHSQATLWKPVDSTTTRTDNNPGTAANGPASTVAPSNNNSTPGNAGQPGLIPPISQVGFESTPASSGADHTGLAGHGPLGATNTDTAPPPPAISDDAPWYVDETQKERKPSNVDVVIRKTSFAMIDRLAETCKLPVSTVISLVCGGGLALIVGGLLALRAALRRRHS